MASVSSVGLKNNRPLATQPLAVIFANVQEFACVQYGRYKANQLWRMCISKLMPWYGGSKKFSTGNHDKDITKYMI